MDCIESVFLWFDHVSIAQKANDSLHSFVTAPEPLVAVLIAADHFCHYLACMIAAHLGQLHSCCSWLLWLGREGAWADTSQTGDSKASR